MKYLTKVSYLLLLAMGFVIGLTTIVYLNRRELMSRTMLEYTVASLSLISGLIAGMISSISPGTKWTRLRGAALAVRSLACTSLVYHFNSHKSNRSNLKRGSFAPVRVCTSSSPMFGATGRAQH